MSKYDSSDHAQFYIGVDGGGTSCRARIEDAEGRLLGQGAAGEEIVAEGARHVDVLTRSLVEFGAPRISLLGGLAARLFSGFHLTSCTFFPRLKVMR
jgi:glucosamine kinase